MNAAAPFVVGFFVGFALTLFSSGCTARHTVSSNEAAYFAFQGSDSKDTFVIQLTDPARITEARAILAGQHTDQVHVRGIVVPQKVAYNPDWSYHLKPDSISFFELAAEVCDANMRYVETHLDQVGGSFLPNGGWCPWASKLVREIPRRELGLR